MVTTCGNRRDTGVVDIPGEPGVAGMIPGFFKATMDVSHA